MSTSYETSMLEALQGHSDEQQRKTYLRFICHNHLALRNLITLYQTGYLYLQDFVDKFYNITNPSLTCLHTLLERNFDAEEVEFRIFRIDIMYVRALGLFAERALRRRLESGRVERIEVLVERLDLFEKEEGEWFGVLDRHEAALEKEC
jgi:hypothetical protein